MATSWFQFNSPGQTPFPNTNPLSYTQYLSVPPKVTGSPTVAYIFATVQIINDVVRPVIPASFSPTGSCTATEINAAVSTSHSSANCYVS